MRLCENNNVFSAFKSCFLAFFRKYSFTALFGFLFGAVLYSPMMSQQLTNTFDGLWQQNYYLSGVTELTSGRPLLLLVDKLLMGLHTDPISSVLALLLFIAGFLLILDLFGMESRLYGCLCLALFISSTALSNTLSYRFTSFGYGLAYLFAILSVYSLIKIKKSFPAILLSGILLGASISCYQAYLSVFCTTLVFYIIFACGKTNSQENKCEKNILYTLVRMLLAVLVGAVFYILTLSLFLKIYGTSLSTYNGIGETSLAGILSALPQNILNTYKFFGAYFFLDKLKITALSPFRVHLLLFVLLALLIIVIAAKVWKQKKWLLAILLPAAAIIPVAANAYMLVAGDKLELQMATGLATVTPLVFILAFSLFSRKKLLQNICILFSAILLYGTCMQVMIDQEAMLEGRNACETMATQVISDLRNENLLSPEYQYYFVGVPAQNPFFSVSDIFYRANAYAQIGNFWTSGNCCQMSYNGLINKHMGFSLPVVYTSYEDIAEKTNLSEMPQFPNNGYITLSDNIVIVKISEYKEYTGFSKYVFD